MSKQPPVSYFTYLAPVYDLMMTGVNRSALRRTDVFQSDLSILDIGGGTGLVRDEFPDLKFDRWVVLDLNREMIRKGREAGRRCSFVRGSALRIPFPSRSFDRVIITDALHHMPDPVRIFREIHRVLVPGGYFVLEEFDPERPLGGLIALSERWAGMQSTFYSPRELRPMLKAGNLEVTRLLRRLFQYYVVARPV